MCTNTHKYNNTHNNTHTHTWIILQAVTKPTLVTKVNLSKIDRFVHFSKLKIFQQNNVLFSVFDYNPCHGMHTFETLYCLNPQKTQINQMIDFVNLPRHCR